MKLHSFQRYSHGLETVVHDAWITTRVKSALALAEPNLGLNVHVKTHAGTVALSGRVNTHRQCEQAVALARTVPGVVNIDASELLTHVFTPGSFPEAPNAEESAERRPQSSAKTDDK
ncbi:MULTISPECIES: BON domain-containing protein [Pseudomonas]|uniref:Phospholipid-binding protein n=1 Tax=Pseudomonas frederiksbergensis TaxID=104087 RepID=A0A2S8HDW5_9PSED|nr:MULTISPECIES: BON domain-containing protein [Pseudomonas]PQP00701.1 phospholipid-binding protein [Pseudomonas frederiksbergensis]WLG53071.1 BON domain-containing protein [Pseudomonas sp. FP1742]